MFNPSLLLWAPTGTLYPAGGSPWNAQPVGVIPAGPYFTPNVPIDAEEVNYNFTSTMYSLQALRDTLVFDALSNWTPATLTDAIHTASKIPPAGACWSAALAGWVVLPWVSAGTSSDPAVSPDGSAWTQLYDSSTHVLGGIIIAGAIANNPADTQYGKLVTIGIETATVYSTRSGISTAGFTREDHTSQAFLAGITQGALARGLNPDWQFLGFIQSGGTFTGVLATSTSGGGAWTDGHLALPSYWASGTNHIGPVFVAQSATTFSMSSDLVWATGGVTAGVDTSHIAIFDPVSDFTDITPSVCTGKIITGLCWDPVGDLWGLLTYDGTDSHLYTSADLSTWKLNRTLAGSRYDGVAAVGTVWAVCGDAAGLLGSRLILSNNVVTAHYANTTSTWGRAVGGSLGADGTTGTPPQLASNGNQLALFTGIAVQISDSVGQIETI